MRRRAIISLLLSFLNAARCFPHRMPDAKAKVDTPNACMRDVHVSVHAIIAVLHVRVYV